MGEVGMTDNKILIFDTTLRDGEQAPGASMTVKEKIKIAKVLDDMNVDIIEGGFPIASKGDFEAVKKISKCVKNSTVAALARSKKEDLDKCVESLKDAKSPKIHTFISTSPLHMKYKLKMSPDQVHESIVESVRYARKFCDNVEWSSEDGTRSDIDFLCRCFESAINEGATTVTIADTVGFTLPSEFSKLIYKIREKVPNIDKAIFSVHCHDDLGLSVANSLAAIEAGAKQIHCTINGIGERAGNAALEEIVMAIETRNDVLPFKTNIKTELLSKASKLVSEITNFSVPENKAVVGKNAFAHESGIHQHGVIMHSATYEIMDPAKVGAVESELIIGKHSGRHALRKKITGLGFQLDKESFEKLFNSLKDTADVKKKISEKDIRLAVKKM